MRRRDFIGLVGCSAVAWRVDLLAQQALVRVVGFLSAESLQQDGIRLAGVREGLRESGYVEGRNLGIEYRGAGGNLDRLPALAGDLVRHPVDAIVAAGVPVTLAAKGVTRTVPIVFSIAGDPVELGLVASIQSPGGNVTGVNSLTSTAISKQIEFLHEIARGTAPIGLLVNPTSPLAKIEIRLVRGAAEALGRQVIVVTATAESEIEPAFAGLTKGGAGGVAVGSNPLFNSRFDKLAVLAMRASLPAVSVVNEFASAGGLMSYGDSLAGSYRLTGVHVGRILNGEKPAELPVVQGTKLELVINLRTAKVLGITIPQSLLARADEVIE